MYKIILVDEPEYCMYYEHTVFEGEDLRKAGKKYAKVEGGVKKILFKDGVKLREDYHIIDPL